MTPPPAISTEKVDAFITRWQGQEGGQERANYVSFLKELCGALDLPQPDPAAATHERNDYVFERAVQRHLDDGDTIGRIDGGGGDDAVEGAIDHLGSRTVALSASAKRMIQ